MSDTRTWKSSDASLPPILPPLGKYRLLREIGRGAMGVVYEALETSKARPVALKLLNLPSEIDPREAKPSTDRFLREAELARAIPPHPGIVAVEDAGVHEGRRFIVMELVRGMPLSQWRRQSSLTLPKHIGMIRDIAAAAHHAHEHGVVHRDLKPENILVDSEGRPRITDFGLAKALAPGGASLTEPGVAVGTPHYMSPEQVRSQRGVDRRTDVYALGVMLYEVLSGRKPFVSDSSFEVMTRKLTEEVVPPSRLSRVFFNPLQFANLEAICMTALARDPADRYPTADAFARDLTRWLRGEEFTIVPPRIARATQKKQMARRIAFALAGGLLALAVTLFFTNQKPPLSLSLLPGAIAEVYSGPDFNALGVRRIDTRSVFENGQDPIWAEAPREWVSFRWTGLLEVPADGTYLFQIRSQEGIRLTVEGIAVVVNGKSHTLTTDIGTVALKKGPSKFLLEHSLFEPDDVLELSWKAEGAGAMTPITPGTLFHDPTGFVPRDPPRRGENGRVDVAGAQEGELLKVLEHSAAGPIAKRYDEYQLFWRGTWSGDHHLWWGEGAKLGDSLRLRFDSQVSGRRALVLALTHASDHGIFSVRVNGALIARALDLYDPNLRTGETGFKDVELRAGPNELEFKVEGSNPQAREWGPGLGLYKLGLDYVLVR